MVNLLSPGDMDIFGRYRPPSGIRRLYSYWNQAALTEFRRPTPLKYSNAKSPGYRASSLGLHPRDSYKIRLPHTFTSLAPGPHVGSSGYLKSFVFGWLLTVLTNTQTHPAQQSAPAIDPQSCWMGDPSSSCFLLHPYLSLNP